jgi:putative oxidoreductase
MSPPDGPKGEYRSAQREGFPTIAIASDSRIGRVANLYRKSAGLIDKLQPLLLLGFRLYVARVFFLSGLTKIHDWSVTLALFTNEYHVPLLPPALAAVMGAATELSIPVLLVLGLATRFGAIVLFFFNIIAVVSYAALPDIAIKDHILWGTMILTILLCGPGKISLDYLFGRRLGASAN